MSFIPLELDLFKIVCCKSSCAYGRVTIFIHKEIAEKCNLKLNTPVIFLVDSNNSHHFLLKINDNINYPSYKIINASRNFFRVHIRKNILGIEVEKKTSLIQYEINEEGLILKFKK